MLKLKAILVCLLWALCYPFISIALNESPPFYLAFARSMLAGVSLLLLTARQAAPVLPRDRRSWSAVTIIGLTYTSLGFSGMFLAGSLVSPGLATVIANLQPMIAVGLAYLFSVERATSRQMIALVIGLAGILVIVFPSFHHQQTNITGMGAGFVVLGAVGVALGNVWTKKVSPGMNVLTLSAWQLVVGSVPLGLIALIHDDASAISWNLTLLTALLVLSLAGTAIATLLWFQVLKVCSLHRMNVFTFLTPLFALLIGAVFLGEVLAINELIGTVIIILGLIILNWRGERDKDNDTQASQEA